MARKGGLGRGLTALIPSAELEASDDAGYREVPIDSVRPNPLQPRRVFDEETLEGLIDSVKELGVLQPILVRAVDDGYELIAGMVGRPARLAARHRRSPAISS